MSDVSAATGDFEKHMFSDTTLIPLAVPNSIFAVSNRVAGFVHTPYSVYVADELSIG
jgi:ABC-type transport system substrate-binding protein